MKKLFIIIFLIILIFSCNKKTVNSTENEPQNIVNNIIIEQKHIPETYEDRINLFVTQGFGFEYNIDEINSRTLFVNNHGNPLKISEENIQNLHNGLMDKKITLEYNNFIVLFYEWNENTEGEFPESMLLRILSKDNIEYLFGIKHGMNIKELKNIFGNINIENNSIWLYNIRGATIVLQNNIIENIIWEYSVE